MSCYCSTSFPLVITGDAEQIRDLLCGPLQHNEHCKLWRWHLYVQDDEKRFAAVTAALHKLHADRRERLTAQQNADLLLQQWQSERGRFA